MSGAGHFRLRLGTVVIATLALNLAIGAVMIFGTLPRLHQLANGQMPFDLRPQGYGPDDAYQLLQALDGHGRDFYAQVQLPIDTAYPASYALSRGLLLWWLTVPGRLTDRPVSLPARLIPVALPIITAVLDYQENAGIAAMLAAGQTASPGLIASTSVMTQAKLGFGFLTEVLCAVFAVVALMRWHWRRRASAQRPST